MKKKQNASRVSIRNIAAAAGVSRSTVGYVMRNQTGPSVETRERVLQVARQLGYVPDPLIASWMARVRGATSKDLLPIAWINTNPEKNAWQKHDYLKPYWRGVTERAEQLGYRLDEMWIHEPGMTMRRISKIIYQRGIEGVIVTPAAKHVHLDWDNLAGVTFGSELLAPHLHRVRTDINFNLLLAVKMVKRFGYRRIGICLSQVFDRISHHVVSSIVYHLAAQTRESRMVPPLFYIADQKSVSPLPKDQVIPWMQKYKPDVVIGHHFRLVDWAREAGFTVPQKMGIVHLALDDDVLDWAGIYSNRHQIGRTTAELVVSLMQNRQFGVPKVTLETTIRGSWQYGRTMLAPKPR